MASNAEALNLLSDLDGVQGALAWLRERFDYEEQPGLSVILGGLQQTLSQYSEFAGDIHEMVSGSQQLTPEEWVARIHESLNVPYPRVPEVQS